MKVKGHFSNDVNVNAKAMVDYLTNIDNPLHKERPKKRIRKKKVAIK